LVHKLIIAFTSHGQQTPQRQPAQGHLTNFYRTTL